MLVAALAAVLAAPVAGQMGYSEGYSFLKAVRSRDGATVQSMIQGPGSTVINVRGERGEGALHIVARGRDLTWLRYLLSNGQDILVQVSKEPISTKGPGPRCCSSAAPTPISAMPRAKRR